MIPRDQESPVTSVRPLSTNDRLPSRPRISSGTCRANNRWFRVAECLRDYACLGTTPDYRITEVSAARAEVGHDPMLPNVEDPGKGLVRAGSITIRRTSMVPKVSSRSQAQSRSSCGDNINNCTTQGQYSTDGHWRWRARYEHEVQIMEIWKIVRDGGDTFQCG